MKHSEIIRRAITIIEERGWCQGSFSNAKGQVCMVGAINLAMIHSTEHCDIVFDVARANIIARLGNRLGCVPAYFNDQSDTTKEQVIAALEEAAKEWEDKGQ